MTFAKNHHCKHTARFSVLICVLCMGKGFCKKKRKKKFAKINHVVVLPQGHY